MRLAVIPARGGSRRIPGKNIRAFCGRPVIAYTIEAAQRAGCFDRVVVSTDDEAIAGVAREAGAEVPFLRPAGLADDHTGTNAVTAHAIDWFRRLGEPPDLACCLYATAPFLRPATILEGLRTLEHGDADFAVTVTPFSFPVQRSVYRSGDGVLRPVWPECIPARSQDLEPAYHDAGQVYWGRAAAFREGRPLFLSRTLGVVVPPERVQDIDTEEDWRLAELKYRLLQADEGAG